MSSAWRRGMLKVAALAVQGIMKQAQAAQLPEYVILPKGKTLSHLSAEHNIPVKSLASYNGIADPNKVQAGAKIWLKQRPVTQAAQPAQPKYTVNNPNYQNMNAVSAYLHNKLNNPDLEAAILANFNHETGGSFSWQQQEKGGKGWGIPQYTGDSRTAYNKWLTLNKRKDSMESQMDYFVGPYMRSRSGYKFFMDPKRKFSQADYADWVHRRVLTPGHTIYGSAWYNPAMIKSRTQGHLDFMRNKLWYNPAMIKSRTQGHLDFMRNKLKPVNGVWQGK